MLHVTHISNQKLCKSIYYLFFI